MVEGLVALAVWLVVLGLIFWLALYLINTLPLFEPYRTVARTILTVFAVLVLIVLLLGFLGVETGMPRLSVR